MLKSRSMTDLGHGGGGGGAAPPRQEERFSPVGALPSIQKKSRDGSRAGSAVAGGTDPDHHSMFSGGVQHEVMEALASFRPPMAAAAEDAMLLQSHQHPKHPQQHPQLSHSLNSSDFEATLPAGTGPVPGRSFSDSEQAPGGGGGGGGGAGVQRKGSFGLRKLGASSHRRSFVGKGKRSTKHRAHASDPGLNMMTTKLEGQEQQSSSQEPSPQLIRRRNSIHTIPRAPSDRLNGAINAKREQRRAASLPNPPATSSRVTNGRFVDKKAEAARVVVRNAIRDADAADQARLGLGLSLDKQALVSTQGQGSVAQGQHTTTDGGSSNINNGAMGSYDESDSTDYDIDDRWPTPYDSIAGDADARTPAAERASYDSMMAAMARGRGDYGRTGDGSTPGEGNDSDATEYESDVDSAGAIVDHEYDLDPRGEASAASTAATSAATRENMRNVISTPDTDMDWSSTTSMEGGGGGGGNGNDQSQHGGNHACKPPAKVAGADARSGGERGAAGSVVGNGNADCLAAEVRGRLSGYDGKSAGGKRKGKGRARTVTCCEESTHDQDVVQDSDVVNTKTGQEELSRRLSQLLSQSIENGVHGSNDGGEADSAFGGNGSNTDDEVDALDGANAGDSTSFDVSRLQNGAKAKGKHGSINSSSCSAGGSWKDVVPSLPTSLTEGIPDSAVIDDDLTSAAKKKKKKKKGGKKKESSKGGSAPRLPPSLSFDAAATDMLAVVQFPAQLVDEVILEMLPEMMADAALDVCVNALLQALVLPIHSAEMVRKKKKSRIKSIKKMSNPDSDSDPSTAAALNAQRPKRSNSYGKRPDGPLEIDLPDRPDAAMLGAGFEASDLLARYSILTPAMLTYYKGVFGKVHAAAGGDLKNQEGSEVISHYDMTEALKAVNKDLINDKEIEYMLRVLDIMEDVSATDASNSKTGPRRLITLTQFAAIAALAEKVTALDGTVKNAISVMDFDALHAKMQKSRDLFFLNNPSPTGHIDIVSLGVEFKASRMDEEQMGTLISRFCAGGKETLSFLDFLSYIPLFVDIHDAITSDPMTEKRRAPLSMFAVSRAKKALGMWKRKAQQKQFGEPSPGASRGGSAMEGEIPLPAEGAADIAAWRMLDEEQISSTHTEVWFGGELIRALLGESRVLVDRSPGAEMFELVFDPRPKARDKANNLTLLVMTCKADLPAAVYLSSVEKNLGRGPAFSKITLSSRELRRGFTLIFTPKSRTLVATGVEGRKVWNALSAAGREAGDAAVADLQQTISQRAGSELLAEKRAKVAGELWRGKVGEARRKLSDKQRAGGAGGAGGASAGAGKPGMQITPRHSGTFSSDGGRHDAGSLSDDAEGAAD